MAPFVAWGVQAEDGTPLTLPSVERLDAWLLAEPESPAERTDRDVLLKVLGVTGA